MGHYDAFGLKQIDVYMLVYYLYFYKIRFYNKSVLLNLFTCTVLPHIFLKLTIYTSLNAPIEYKVWQIKMYMIHVFIFVIKTYFNKYFQWNVACVFWEYWQIMFILLTQLYLYDWMICIYYTYHSRNSLFGPLPLFSPLPWP